MCGFIGVVAPEGRHVIAEIYDGLISIQHRGQDAAGAVTYSGRFNVKKGNGLVRDVFEEKHMLRLSGRIGLGHVRYPTVGDGSADDAQPFVVTSPFGIALAHNGNLTNFSELKNELTQRDHRLVDSNCDAEAILQVFAHSLANTTLEGELDDEAVFEAVEDVFKRCLGAYSVVAVIANYGLVAFRDPKGIKPIVIGERQEGFAKSWCVASESVLLDMLDYHKSYHLKAGEAVVVRMDGTMTRRQVRHEKHHPCLFEWVYFARPDSFLDQVSVYQTRVLLGERLAERWKKTRLKADVVIPVPESARDAAIVMARMLGLPYSEGLVKNRYIGRTFIMPDNLKRRKSIHYKLNAIQDEFDSKDVLLVDDSIVRGNTSRQIVQLARAAGAHKVYFASYSPPLRHPCVYGIDMSTRNEFVAKGRTEVEIASEIGADAVLYQSLEDLESSVRAHNSELRQFCNACFTGNYPTEHVNQEVLHRIERERELLQQEH